MMLTRNQPIDQLIIFSGAGLSAESGLSTYHDENGIWQEYNMLEVCYDRTWQANFEKVHQFYNQLRQQVANAQPNPAHFAIAKLKQHYGDRCHVITQNVDNLLERAGCHEVLHVHGLITEMACIACGRVWEVGYEAWDTENHRCTCNSRKGVKPNIVFFGGKAVHYPKMYKRFQQITKSPKNLVLVVGTDGSVIQIDDLLNCQPCQKVLCNLHPSIHINDDQFDWVLHEPASTGLEKVLNYLTDRFLPTNELHKT